MFIKGKRFNFVIQLFKYLSQTFFMSQFFLFYQVTAYGFTSITRTLFLCARTFLILKKITEDYSRPSTNYLTRVPRNIGILKAIFMRGHHFKLQFFGQLMRENCRTVKWDSWLLGVLNIVSKSLGKLYPTNLKIIIQRLLLLSSYTDSL